MNHEPWIVMFNDHLDDHLDDRLDDYLDDPVYDGSFILKSP